MSTWGDPNYTNYLRYDEISKETITINFNNNTSINYVAVVSLK